MLICCLVAGCCDLRFYCVYACLRVSLWVYGCVLWWVAGELCVMGLMLFGFYVGLLLSLFAECGLVLCLFGVFCNSVGY